MEAPQSIFNQPGNNTSVLDIVLVIAIEDDGNMLYFFYFSFHSSSLCFSNLATSS